MNVAEAMSCLCLFVLHIILLFLFFISVYTIIFLFQLDYFVGPISFLAI